LVNVDVAQDQGCGGDSSNDEGAVAATSLRHSFQCVVPSSGIGSRLTRELRWLLGVLLAEMFASKQGLGFLIMNAIPTFANCDQLR
jgi:hypothetical protein